jgi:hypothetical protein
MSSDRALHYFPQNNPYNFKTHLNAPLLLEGVWKVALVDVDIVSSTSKTFCQAFVGSLLLKVKRNHNSADYQPPPGEIVPPTSKHHSMYL